MMQWYAILYLAFFLVLGIGGIWSDIRDGKPRWFIVAALLANAVLVWLYVGYWYPQLVHMSSLLFVVLFGAAIIWEAYQAWDDYRDGVRESNQFSDQGLTVICGISAVLLCIPIYIISGISVFRP